MLIWDRRHSGSKKKLFQTPKLWSQSFILETKCAALQSITKY